MRYHWLLGYSENRMDTQPKGIIDLSKYNNVGIILKLGSGVFYANKAAGLACQYPGIEGAFYPLPVKPGNAELFSLTQRFKGPWIALICLARVRSRTKTRNRRSKTKA